MRLTYEQWLKSRLSVRNDRINKVKVKINILSADIASPHRLVRGVLNPSDEFIQIRVDRAKENLRVARRNLVSLTDELELFTTNSERLWKPLEVRINNAMDDLSAVMKKHNLEINFGYEGDLHDIYNESTHVYISDLDTPIYTEEGNSLESL